jgi:cytochrome c-type biogenesis protein CcmH/NrfG
MAVSNEDLPSLIQRKDHLGILRYIRSHELREPKLVVTHGQALLGKDLSSKRIDGDAAARLAVLEQVCLAALDMANHELAEVCLSQLKLVVDKDSARFRRLLARCLEASGGYEQAEKIYDGLLKDNPANVVALQRKYCLARAQGKEPREIIDALNEYLGQQMMDVSGWYEMAQLRLSLADFKGAAYALEQVVLGSPLDADIHRQLAEVYATIGGLENLTMARKHMAQALELDSTNIRAQFGLVSVANQYLEELAAANTKVKKDIDEHDELVAKELVKYGTAEVLKSYKGTKMFETVKRVMDDYTENIEG